VQELPREELLDRIEKAAYGCETDYHGCSRCVVATLRENLGLGDDSCISAAVPLAGGIARTANTCGALLGGLMAIGLAFASSDKTDTDNLFKTLQLARAYYTKFESEVGHVLCRDIRVARLGRFYDTVDPDEHRKFNEAGGNEACAEVAAKAARLAAEFILDERQKAELA
jgi:C_GCAxxG_C_C family probable redox protein